MKKNSPNPELFEPVLINKDKPVSPVTDERTYEFNVGTTSKENEGVKSSKDTSDTDDLDKENPVVYDLHEHSLDEAEDDQFRKTRDRIARLKALNYRINNTGAITDMEKEPAYKRRNVKLDNVPHSSDNNVSRYTLSSEEDKKSELRQNNSFLHDNVD